MLKKILYAAVLCSLAFISVQAQTVQNNSDMVMILPFENTSAKAEFNWVGESFANSLTDLLKVPGLNVVSNDERKIIHTVCNSFDDFRVWHFSKTGAEAARRCDCGIYNIIPRRRYCCDAEFHLQKYSRN